MSVAVRTVVLMLAATAVVLLLVSQRGQVSVRLVYNPTPSAPRGWYFISAPTDVAAGHYVLARLPTDAAKLAGDRRYLPRGVPILKRIGAAGGQAVCVRLHGDQATVEIDGRPVGRARGRDGAGRPLPAWQHCRVLAMDELFLLSPDNAASFDSRYFGPIRRDAVIGRATPLWTW